MKEEFEFLWWHMRGDFGWPMAIVSWVTVLRFTLKPVNGFFETYIQARPAAQTAWAQRLLSSSLWGFVVFTLDYVASVKLPRIKSGDTDFIRK